MIIRCTIMCIHYIVWLQWKRNRARSAHGGNQSTRANIEPQKYIAESAR